ncbi:MAG: polyphosphate kinase 2 [Pseudomonadota bacterium]
MTHKKNSKHDVKDVSEVLDAFDLDHPSLPGAIADNAMTSGGYPYPDKMNRADYYAELRALQIELVKLQKWTREQERRIILVFEGRDAAGKGGSIKAFRENMNPRHARVVALSKPSETERGQWYFQRYINHFPTNGEIVLFDRSWYNRAGVERVMGFSDHDAVEDFLEEVPRFEGMLAREGITLVKFWLNIGRAMQLKRFHARRHDPLKIWKLSPIDLAALGKWDDYTEARDRMFERTHTDHAPWTIVRTNDKRRGRLNAIRYLLTLMDYDGKDRDALGTIDPAILGYGPGFLSPSHE